MDCSRDECPATPSAGSPELRNIGRGLAAASETTPAPRTPNSDLVTKLATLESQLVVQRALTDERLMMLDQLRATVRALNGGITKAKSKPRWWRKS